MLVFVHPTDAAQAVQGSLWVSQHHLGPHLSLFVVEIFFSEMVDGHPLIVVPLLKRKARHLVPICKCGNCESPNDPVVGHVVFSQPLRM